MQTLLTNMQSALAATLGGMGATVTARAWDPERLPDFDRLGVVLSPGQASEEPLGVLGIELTLPVRIVCLTRVTGAADLSALLGLASAMMSALRNNTLSGVVIASNDPFGAVGIPGPVSPTLPHVLGVTVEYSGRRRVRVIT